MHQLTDWYLLLFIPFIIALFFIFRKEKSLQFSSLLVFKQSSVRPTRKHYFEKIAFLLGLSLIIAGLARPQSADKNQNLSKFGIDMVIVLDVSGTMKSVDFKPNRLEVAKKVIQEFVRKRITDRIGLVIFAGTAYTKIPLTVDYMILENSLTKISTEDVNKDGTAIGVGISVALNRLKQSDTKTKIIILATDGDNNAGTISPETSAQLAKDLQIKIYTIGVGSNRTIIPVESLFGTSYQQVKGGINEDLLKFIAAETGAKYFRAWDENDLKQIFTTIDQLEKTRFEMKNLQQYNELFHLFVIAGLCLMLLGFLLKELLYIKIP